MSLDLLKERFGNSVKKQADNEEKIHEKLNDKFNYDGMDDLKSFKSFLENVGSPYVSSSVEVNVPLLPFPDKSGILVPLPSSNLQYPTRPLSFCKSFGFQ